MASGTPTYKVVLCGEYGVGKSSLFRRFVDNSFTENTGPRSTVGLDHISKEFPINGKLIKVVRTNYSFFIKSIPHIYIVPILPLCI